MALCASLYLPRHAPQTLLLSSTFLPPCLEFCGTSIGLEGVIALQCRPFAREWLTAFPTLTSLSFRVAREISEILPSLGRHVPELQQLTLTCSDLEVDVIPYLAEWAQSMPRLHTLTLITAHTLDCAISITVLRNLLCFTVAGCWPALQVLELRGKKFTADPNMEEYGVLGRFELEFQQQMLTVIPADGVNYMGMLKRL